MFDLLDECEEDLPLSQFSKTSHATDKEIQDEIIKGNSGVTAYGYNSFVQMLEFVGF